jgi:CBS domain-containing protein
MTQEVLTITPGRTLRDAARFLSEHNVGSAVIFDPEQPGPGIVSERDIVRSLGAGQDPDQEKAADAMARGGFRHLVVVSDGEVQGIISMRDIMAVWRPSARS